MTNQAARDLAWLIRAQFDLPDLILHLTRLLAEGEPVTLERAAAVGGWSVDELRAELAKHPGTDWDDAGRLVGFGLTLRPTPHTFTTEDRTVYAFCASDALMFPMILDRAGVVRSICPATGRPIRVEVTPHRVVSVDPPEAVVSKLRPDQAVADFRSEICALGNLFADRRSAGDWLEANPHGHVVPVADDFEVNRGAVFELGWRSADPTG